MVPNALLSRDCDGATHWTLGLYGYRVAILAPQPSTDPAPKARSLRAYLTFPSSDTPTATVRVSRGFFDDANRFLMRDAVSLLVPCFQSSGRAALVQLVSSRTRRRRNHLGSPAQ